MTENPLKYPWLNIVQFHKEFVNLEQENFFKIRIGINGQPDPSKCLVFRNFFPESVDAAWEVPDEEFQKERIFEEIKRGGILEGYLGGPCWTGWMKDENTKKWVSYISPLLYQHVKVEYDEEKHILLFIPDEGRWEIPSITYNEINKREFSLDIPPEELPFKIIENAHLNCEKNNRTLSENIIEETITRIPPLQELFGNSTSQNGKPNNPWIFFVTPLAEKSVYAQHLMPDYETLEQRLKDNPTDIGGLRVLESSLRPDSVILSKTTLYPLIPLNQSQEMAVEGVLEEKPITVISGPPGCGKSQVVVSLLLNAWAEGKSVLFASNTKAAVDVVYDRLKEYECEYPIAVRAGNRDRNTTNSSLDKLQSLTVRKKTGSYNRNSTQKEIADLFQKKQEYQQFLDNKIPQRITQAKQTASRSFLDLVAVSKEILSNIEEYQKQVGILGYSGVPISRFEDEVFAPLKKWRDGIEISQNTIKNDEQQRQEYSQKILSLERERDAILSRLGFASQVGTNYGWLIHGPSPIQFEQWLTKYRDLLSDDIERYYTSNLNETHKKWNSESDARMWIELSEELVNKINNLVTINKEKYSKYTDIKTRHDTVKSEVINAHLLPEVPFDKQVLVQWKQEYSHHLSIPDGILSFLKRRSSEASLQHIEQTFQSYYPPEVWAVFSHDRNTGRNTLNTLIDLTKRWMDIREEWQNFGSDRIQIERECADIEQIRKTLQLQKFIFNYREDLSFIEISHQIKGLETTAREAADTWCLYAKKERLLADLRALALQLDTFVLNSPIVKVWSDQQGLEFAHIIRELKSQPTFELIAKSWNFCSSDRFTSFIDDWNSCQNLQKNIEEYTNHFQNVPSIKTRISEWWGQKPRYCAINKIDQSAFPLEGDVLHIHIRECEDLNNRWRENSETILKELERQKKEHFKRTIQNLQVSYDAIPPSMWSEKIKAVYTPILNQSIDEPKWISDDGEEVFNQFNPERIQASINQINSRLADLSFSLAKDNYLTRISEEAYILEDVDALRRHFKETYQSARGFSRKKYVNALKAVPIWVTNAHNAKSFPMEPEVFDILVIDEASQCSLTNLLPLLYRAKTLAIIGDPNQLSAIFKGASKGKEQTLAIKHGISECLESFGHLDNTMFDLGLKMLPGGRKNMINLVEHYRSHPLIIGFSNLYIYQMRLSLRKDTQMGEPRKNVTGVFGVNIVGDCSRGINGKSWVNAKEAKMVCDIVKDLQNSDVFSGKSIGIVTPFSSQREKIMELLQDQYFSSKEILIGNSSNVLVGTVDTFQGNERDIMIFSPVISRNMLPNTAKWSDDKNRINVALTRARDLMIVVGDFDYCRKMDSILGKLIEYVEMISLLRQTSYAELELFSLMIMEGNDLKISSNNLPKIHQRIGRLEVDFVLHNMERGVHLVVEVDGKQHYYVEINGAKHSVKYEGLKRFVEINNERYFFHFVGKQEFVTVKGENYPVIQTSESIQDDKGRDALLKSEGYKVHRIHVRDIYDKPAVVINDIKEKLEITRS
jgi:very-short-patch-repair endonuclease